MRAFFAAVAVILLPLRAAEPADAVQRWNAEFLSTVRRQAIPPCLVARNLAILHLAIWRAASTCSDGSEPAAVSVAGHEVCTTLFSGDRSGFDTLLGEFPPAEEEVATLARHHARATLAERQDDGSNTTVHYHPDLAPGVWQRTTNNRPPELPHWGNVRPFALESAAMFRPPPPPSLSGPEYAADVNEVRELGGAAPGKRTPDQEQTARFWSDFSYTSSPVGRWNEIAWNALAGRQLTTREKARLFAILNISMADAGIATWDCKYHYRFWRPVSAIHETYDDGNALTSPDREWKSLLPSPSHPDYVSGHSTFSGAAATVLEKLTGPLQAPIGIANVDMPGVVRTFPDFDAIAHEAGRSRVYGGIHFTEACKQGDILGRKVAERVIARFDQIAFPVPAK